MPPLAAMQQIEPKRPPLNLDYRYLSLLLFFGTRADLFADYLAGANERQREAPPHSQQPPVGDEAKHIAQRKPDDPIPGEVG